MVLTTVIGLRKYIIEEVPAATAMPMILCDFRTGIIHATPDCTLATITEAVEKASLFECPPISRLPLIDLPET